MPYANNPQRPNPRKANRQKNNRQSYPLAAAAIPAAENPTSQSWSSYFCSAASDIASKTRGALAGVSRSLSLLPAAVIAISTFPEAAAKLLGLKFFVGEYEHMDTCLGSLMDCLQGYAVNGTEDVLRWSRSVAATSGSTLDEIFAHFMRNYMSADKIQSMLEATLENGGKLVSDTVCTLPSQVWGGIQSLGQILGLDELGCNVMKKAFEAFTRDARNNAVAMFAALIGGSIASIAFVIGMVFLVRHCIDKHGCCDNGCHRDRGRQFYTSV